MYTNVTKISMLPNICHYSTETEVVQEDEDEMVLVLVEVVVVEEGEE
jgi:hypothetical protein